MVLMTSQESYEIIGYLYALTRALQENYRAERDCICNYHTSCYSIQRQNRESTAKAIKWYGLEYGRSVESVKRQLTWRDPMGPASGGESGMMAFMKNLLRNVLRLQKS